MPFMAINRRPFPWNSEMSPFEESLEAGLIKGHIIIFEIEGPVAVGVTLSNLRDDIGHRTHTKFFSEGEVYRAECAPVGAAPGGG